MLLISSDSLIWIAFYTLYVWLEEKLLKKQPKLITS